MALGAEHAGPSHGASHLGEAPRVARLSILGRPGAHANLLLRQARHALLTQWAIGAALCAAGAACYFLTSSWIPSVAFVVSGIAFGKIRGSSYETAAARARVGRDAERRVARTLEKWGKSHGATVIAHGAYPGRGGDIDHMLFGGRAVVVETKYGRGNISLAGTTITVGTRKIPGDPVAQCRRQRDLVVRHSGLPVLGVVCISEGTGPVRRSGDIVLCSARDLPKVLAQATPCGQPSEQALRACGVGNS